MKSTNTQFDIASSLKADGPSTTEEVANRLQVSYETARAQIARMADMDLVAAVRERTSEAGRPVSRWRLTSAGEHLFPKQYGELAVSLLKVLADKLPPEHIDAVLSGLVDQKVAGWLPRLSDENIESRLHEMLSIYSEDDQYISIERDGNSLRLIERNCPFLDVAEHHPILCSLTVNTLERTLGRKVIREEKFQDGAGRCVFRVTDVPPADNNFHREV